MSRVSKRKWQHGSILYLERTNKIYEVLSASVDKDKARAILHDGKTLTFLMSIVPVGQCSPENVFYHVGNINRRNRE